MDRKERIAEVLAGKSVFRGGSLTFSCPKVAFTVRAGEIKEGSFLAAGREGMPLSGIVVTGDIRMRCLTTEIAGNPAELFFRFDSTGLEEGETARGDFKIISNQGEYLLPYMVTVAPKIFETSLGQMKNLFHFANLAKTSWQEAVKAFYSPDFVNILTGNERQYLNVYRALSMPPETEQKVEEFLVWIRKKQKVQYIPDKESITVFPAQDVMRETITLTRNGWGYTRLQAETEGEFLKTEKSILTDDDFLGNKCVCGLLIFHDALHAGYNYGKVRFYNEYVSIEIPVCVNHTDTLLGREKRNRKRKVLEFYQYYLQYSMGKISRQKWLAETEAIVNGMNALGRKNPIQELFQAHILLTRERYNEAKWLLDQAGNLMVPEETKPSVSCYYLYLTTLLNADENYVRAVTEEIRRLYQSDQTNWEIAWLLLYLDEECSRSLSRKWVFLEQQFEKGCHSPVWYMEAAILVRKNPSLLMRLTPFVMQILNFMAKYDYLTEECIGQIHYLAGRLKRFSKRMYDILRICYEKKKDEESLRAICGLLIKGNKTGPEYAGWYREGIKRELWLTRLYEYYMLSVDLQREEDIPPAALRYFSYRSQLPYDRKAYLYAYVIRKKEVYPDLYRIYLSDMECFLSEQLEKKRMDRNTACLCRELIQEGIVDKETVSKYADRLFINEIRLFSPDIRRVIAVHGKLQGEISCPVNGMSAYIPFYDKDFSLIFEKASGCRFVCDISYEKNTLFYSEELLSEVLPEEAGLFPEEAGVLLYQCEHGKSYTVIDKSNAKYARKLWTCGGIREAYRNELGMKLLQYYVREDLMEELDGFLLQLQPQSMNGRERAEAVQLLILRGMYDTAYEWLGRYGAEKMTPKIVVRLCSRLLAHKDFQESESMTGLTYFAFQKGKYDENILRYLSQYFHGTTKELGALWSACKRFDTGCYELSERLLLQMFFTEEFILEESEVFRDYLEGSAEETLTGGYLIHFAYQYFMHGQELEPYIWKELKRKSRNGEPQEDICEIALLKHFSEQEKPDEEECRMIRAFLEDLVLKKGILFGFFGKFAEQLPAMAGLKEKTFLEYRSESGNPAMLHYMIQADGKSGEYRTDEWKSCFDGIYTRNFSLFYGEKLQYYITERRGGKEKLTESGTLTGGPEMENAGGRFAMTNRLLRAVSAQEYEQAEKVLETYYQTEFSVKQLFTLQ